MGEIMPSEVISSKIYFLRGQKVMLDKDLAALYSVETRIVNQAVRRNIERFPKDFMFQLSKEETMSLSRSQFVILNQGQNIKFLPYAFTEHGILMLSSVLRSEKAVQVNIQIMRTFVEIRKQMFNFKKLHDRIFRLEAKCDGKFKVVFDTIREIIIPQERTKKKIGFLRNRD